MELMESIRAGFKELIVPELDRIREENREIRAILEVTNKRLDDVNLHLADQSRRIDALREELRGEIAETNKRIDAVRVELSSEITETNKRLDRLYEVIVRRDEHAGVERRVAALEHDMAEIKRRLAA